MQQQKLAFRISCSPLPGESWHLQPEYMIPVRLPWRHRARPSATLHEILSAQSHEGWNELVPIRLAREGWFVKYLIAPLENLRLSTRQRAICAG